jgi:transposase
MEVVEGQGQQKVEAYPDKLTEPEKVKPVAMDMHEAFRQAIQMCLSHARVVADKFHLIRHIYYCYPELKEARIFKEGFRTWHRETDRSRAEETLELLEEKK